MEKYLTFVLAIVLISSMVLLTGCGDSGVVASDKAIDYEQGMVLAEYEGITITGGEFEDSADSDYVIDLQINNESDKELSVMVESSVNGFETHAYQSLGAMPKSECGYLASIPTNLFKTYGMGKIGQIDFRVLIIDDEDDFSEVKPLFISDTYRIKTELYSEMDTEFSKDSYFYENDGIKAQVKFMEQPTYTLMAFCYENENNQDATIILNKVVLNGEPMDISGYERVYTVPVVGKTTKFAYFPLYNYTWNEKTNEVKKQEVKSLVLGLDINGESTEDITIK